MAKETIHNIENKLVLLGYRKTSLMEVPDIINRIEITLRFAHIYYNEKQVLSETDKKWCSYYSHYIHFLDSEKFEKLGELYYELIEQMKLDNCFSGQSI